MQNKMEEGGAEELMFFHDIRFHILTNSLIRVVKIGWYQIDNEFVM